MNAINALQYCPKFLKLETLSRRQAYLIVGVNWLAVLFACVFGAFEYNLRVDTATLVAEQSGEYSYRAVVDGFAPASRFVLANVMLRVLGNATAAPLPLYAARVSALAPDSPHWLVLAAGNLTTSLASDATLCGNATACRVGPVFWSDEVLYSTYEFAVEFASGGAARVADVRFLVTRHSSTFTLVELSLVMTLCLITVVCFLYWIVLWQRSRKLLPEQRWMPFLLLSLLGGQRPLFAVSALMPYSFAWATTAGVLQVVSYGAASVSCCCCSTASRTARASTRGASICPRRCLAARWSASRSRGRCSTAAIWPSGSTTRPCWRCS